MFRFCLTGSFFLYLLPVRPVSKNKHVGIVSVYSTGKIPFLSTN